MQDNTQKMLRVIINGQSSFRQEVLGKIGEVDKRLGEKIDKLDEKVDKVEKNLTIRIDKIGMQLAYLEEDAPTREEFDKLGSKVDKIDQRITPTL